MVCCVGGQSLRVRKPSKYLRLAGSIQPKHYVFEPVVQPWIALTEKTSFSTPPAPFHQNLGEVTQYVCKFLVCCRTCHSNGLFGSTP